MKNSLRYKEKTPRSLNNLLLGTLYFKTHWKKIPSVVRTLNHILQWNNIDGGESEITYQYFQNRFGPDYVRQLQILKSVNLLIRGHSYIVGGPTHGKCKEVRLTPLCHQLLSDSNREYLHKLLQDSVEKRRNQVRISKRGYNKLEYNDVRDTLKETIDGITFDLGKVSELTRTFSPEKSALTYSLLIDIVERNYNELKHNTADNRIWSPYTQLPSEVRSIIKIKGLSYQMTMDIRSCYPSLWAHYVTSYPNLPHIVLGKVNNELGRYNNIFLNPDIDPKSHLSNRLRIDRSEIKEVLISYYNGKGFKGGKFIGVKGRLAFQKYDEWLKLEFPTLYAMWIQTDIKQTGNNIGKYFETKLMLDQSIYKKADELGIIIGYEYDGMSFYATDTTNCQTLLNYIKSKSVALLGIELGIRRIRSYRDLSMRVRLQPSQPNSVRHKRNFRFYVVDVGEPETGDRITK